MKLSSICFTATAFLTTSCFADEDSAVDMLLGDPPARLIKDSDPIAEATYHESDPIVAVRYISKY